MSDFRLGNMATDLVEFTLTMCNKDESGKPRFPTRLYDSYVKRISDLSLDVIQNIFIANAVRDDPEKRKKIRDGWKIKGNKVKLYVKDFGTA